MVRRFSGADPSQQGMLLHRSSKRRGTRRLGPTLVEIRQPVPTADLRWPHGASRASLMRWLAAAAWPSMQLA